MPFIPHTKDETKEMLDTIGISDLNTLFDEIPQNIRINDLPGIPETLSEQDVTKLMKARAKQDEAGLCFIGAGAYEHHIPAAIFDLISRGEYLTAYTPYQAEASQGTLQLIYEYQTMMAQLTGMDVSNASQYDGASALAEAILMSVRLNRKSKSKRILLPANIHPHYRETVKSLVEPQDISLTNITFDPATGGIQMDALKALEGEDITALVISQPSFFGTLEEVDILTDWAKSQDILVIAVVNPTALALLKPPGQWGESGADIVCGEGQPLGVPLSSGGPYFGFLTCKQAHVRQMPGRIVGRTTDMDGKRGFTLTLQAREQHIRRSKATSNICTNQGLLVTAATIYMSLLGAEGIRRVAASSHENTITLKKLLTDIEGIEAVFAQPSFHECVLRLNRPVKDVLNELADKGIQGGLNLTPYYPELGNALLICATETKSAEDLKAYADAMKEVMGEELINTSTQKNRSLDAV
jgi:glycine dehydrogenase subunit 1